MFMQKQSLSLTCLVLVIIGFQSSLFAKFRKIDLNKKYLSIGTTQSIIDFWHNAKQLPGENNYIRNFIAPPLVVVDSTGRWGCHVCTKIPSFQEGTLVIGKNGKVISYWEIKSEYYWEDGTPLTGDDVAYTFEKLKESTATDAPYFLLENVVVDRKNRRKFKIIFRKNQSDYYYLLAISLLSKETHTLRRNPTKNHPQENRLSYGIYRVVSTASNRIILGYNKGFRGKKNSFGTIVINRYPNTDVLTEGLISGKVDMIKDGLLSGNQAYRLSKALSNSKKLNERFRLVYFPGPLEYIMVNLRNPNLSDGLLRKALLLGIDRKRITEEVFKGFAFKAEHLIVSKNTYYTPTTQKYAYNPKLATKILNDTGWYMGDDGVRNKMGIRLSVSITTASDSNRRLIAKIIRENWNKLGVATVIKPQNKTVFLTETIKKSRFRDLALLSCHGPIISLLWSSFHTSEIPTANNLYRGHNTVGWVHNEVNLLLRKLVREHEFHAQKGLITKIIDHYLDELPVLPLLFRPIFMVIPRSLRKFQSPLYLFESSVFAEEW